MRLPWLLLAVLLVGCAPRTESLPPLDPPLNHFSILVGVARLQDDPRLASPPEQARRLLDRLQWLKRNSRELLQLDGALAEALDGPQRDYLRGRLGDADPIGFFQDLDWSLDLLRKRGGPGCAEPAAPMSDSRPPGGDDGVDCVLIAHALASMDAQPELRVTQDQARRLGPLLARVRVLALEDEQSMRYLYHSLDPAQKDRVQRRTRGWTGGRSARQLEEEFEGLLAEAERRLEGRLAGLPSRAD